MRRRTAVPTLLFLALLGLVSAVDASSIRPPRNLGQLARHSSAVVLARAGVSWVEEHGPLPVTVTSFDLIEPVGPRRTQWTFHVTTPGGAGAQRAAVVGGAPRFSEGREYLLFLERAKRKRWQTRMLAYGVLEVVPGRDLLRPVPEARELLLVRSEGAERVGVYRKEAMIEHLGEVIAGQAWRPERVLAPRASAIAELHTKPLVCEYTKHSDGVPVRWFGYETGATSSIFHTTPGQVGIADGGVAAVQQGTAAWTNHAASVIRFQYAGSRATAISCSQPGSDIDQGAAVFNDPCGDIGDLVGCMGTLGFGGSFYNPSAFPVHDGEAWHPASTPFVVINNGAQCVGETGFREMMTHELGHTQGFGHHTDPNATMASPIKNDGRGASLAQTDRACAAYAYHTFTDVASSFWAWAQIEAIENAGITTGCAPGRFCPSSLTFRDEMAAFLVRGIHGAGFVPPAPAGIFADVPASHWAAAWIEQLYADGVTTGCAANPFRYCPSQTVNRAEMAVFLLRAKHGGGYTPPPATGTVFLDVPASFWAAAWIEQLYDEGITTGCAAAQYCPNGATTRAEMAAFLQRTFGLPLPQ